jgi:ribonuclease-3
MNEKKLTVLQEKLDHKFNDITLLNAALTHSSYANENVKRGSISNERLEFLGDSILGMAVAALIYNEKPNLTEGQMTRLRAELVCEKSLAALATELGLGEYLILGRGEEKSGGRNRPSLRADAFEAILAAMYLDGGFEPVRALIAKIFKSRLDSPILSITDYKTALQEAVQVKSGHSLVYHLVNEQGPDHEKQFTVEARLNDKALGTGTGKSKKIAEQNAAKAAIERLSH